MKESKHQKLARDFNKLSYDKPCAYCGGETKYSGIPVCEHCWENKLSDEDRKRLGG